jgi:hypothetical protein
MVGSTLIGSIRLSLATSSDRRGTASRSGIALVAALLAAPLCGCETMQSLVSGDAFKGEPATAVPARKTVGTSTTRVGREFRAVGRQAGRILGRDRGWHRRPELRQCAPDRGW